MRTPVECGHLVIVPRYPLVCKYQDSVSWSHSLLNNKLHCMYTLMEVQCEFNCTKLIVPILPIKLYTIYATSIGVTRTVKGIIQPFKFDESVLMLIYCRKLTIQLCTKYMVTKFQANTMITVKLWIAKYMQLERYKTPFRRFIYICHPV